MNGENTDPSRHASAQGPLVGPATSPRTGVAGPGLTSLSDLLPPFAGFSRNDTAASQQPPTPVETLLYDDFPWLADEPSSASVPVAEDHGSLLEPIGIEALTEVEPIGIEAFVEEDPIGIEAFAEMEPFDIETFGEVESIGTTSSPAPVLHEPEPWELLAPESASPAAPPLPSPELPDWFMEEGVDTTGEWLLDSHLDAEAELSEDVGEPIPFLVPEPPFAGSEEAAATPNEPPLGREPHAEARAPMLTEVAARLERIAQALRHGAAEEIFDPESESDPLQLLITGYAMGYAEARRTAAEKRGR